jgi:hypothetical protein
MNYGNSLTEIVAFNGLLIISSDYGQVLAFDPDKGKFRLIFENKHHPIRAMLAGEDTLLLGVYGTGVILMDKMFTITDTLIHAKSDSGLIASAIATMYIDRFDSLWVGGFGGLSKYNPRTKQLETRFAFTESSSYLTSILEDPSGNLWIGSNRGIYKFDRGNQQLILSVQITECPPEDFISTVAKSKMIIFILAVTTVLYILILLR